MGRCGVRDWGGERSGVAASARAVARVCRQWQARGRGLPLTPFETELLSCLKSDVVTPLE